MRRTHLTVLLIALALLVSSTPTLAQHGNPAVTDLGSNIYLVDGNKGPIPNLLPADAVAKIARLQSPTGDAFLVLLSPISPDDKPVFTSRNGRGVFITLEDGTSVSITLPSDFGGQISNIFWLDANTMAFYALSTSTNLPTLFTWDRRTGEGRALNALPLTNQIPVFASADGRKLLLASVPPVDPANPGAALVSPSVSAMIPAMLDNSAGRLGLMLQVPAGTPARALLDFAVLFGSVGTGGSNVTAGSVLSVLDTATGERREVVQIGPDAEVGEASFSQDGSQFAVALVVYIAQAEIVAQLRARGWANKVGIVGCSYGGYFVNQSITRHPSTYDAAHAQCSLVDLFIEWNRGFPILAPTFQGLPPHAAPEEYRRDSPAYNAGQVRTPLLAFHGTADFLPVTVMENFMLQVINNQVPAKMLKFQGADHGFWGLPPELRAAYERYGAQEQIIWFRTYLMEK